MYDSIALNDILGVRHMFFILLWSWIGTFPGYYYLEAGYLLFGVHRLRPILTKPSIYSFFSTAKVEIYYKVLDGYTRKSFSYAQNYHEVEIACFWNITIILENGSQISFSKASAQTIMETDINSFHSSAIFGLPYRI